MTPSLLAQTAPPADPGDTGGGFFDPAAMLVDAMRDGARAALEEIARALAEGAVWVLERVAGWMGEVTRPDVAQPWFAAVYSRAWGVAVLVTVPVFLAAVAGASIAGHGIGRVVRQLVVVQVAIGVGLVLLDVGVAAVDELAAMVMSSAAGEAATAFQGAAPAVAGLVGGLAAGSGMLMVAAALAGVVLLLGLAVLAVLELREALVYLLAVFAVVVSAGAVWPRFAHAAGRTVRTLAAVVVAKIPVAICMALAASALAGPGGGFDPADEGTAVGAMFTAGAFLALAAAAPWALIQLFDVVAAQVTSATAGRVSGVAQSGLGGWRRWEQTRGGDTAAVPGFNPPRTDTATAAATSAGAAGGVRAPTVAAAAAAAAQRAVRQTVGVAQQPPSPTPDAAGDVPRAQVWERGQGGAWIPAVAPSSPAKRPDVPSRPDPRGPR